MEFNVTSRLVNAYFGEYFALIVKNYDQKRDVKASVLKGTLELTNVALDEEIVQGTIRRWSSVVVF
jgi:hypothetical protein